MAKSKRRPMLAGDIQNLLDSLVQAEIAIDINPVDVRNQRYRNRAIDRLTWCSAGAGDALGVLFRQSSAGPSWYCDLVAARVFSAMLYDGALLQITYDLVGNTVCGHRLAYVPCPFVMDEELLRVEPLDHVVKLYLEQPASQTHMRSPLRFDFAPEDQSPGHPASHLTLIHDDCRWPVIAPLPLGHFIRFVFLHFYPALWKVHRFLRELPLAPVGGRCVTAEEEAGLHVAWRLHD